MYIELGKKFFQNFFNNPSLKIQTRLFFQNKITNYNEKTLRLPPNNIEGLKRSNSPYSFPNFVKRNKKREKETKNKLLHSEAWRFSDSFAIFAGVLILGGVDKRKNDGRNAATFQTVGEIETSSGQFPVKPIPRMELCGVCDFVHTHAHTYIYPSIRTDWIKVLRECKEPVRRNPLINTWRSSVAATIGQGTRCVFTNESRERRVDYIRGGIKIYLR